MRVSAHPLLAAPCCVLHWQICLYQVGKDTEAQAFLGKLDTDREVGGMVDATVSWNKSQSCYAASVKVFVKGCDCVRLAAWWALRPAE